MICNKLGTSILIFIDLCFHEVKTNLTIDGQILKNLKQVLISLYKLKTI